MKSGYTRRELLNKMAALMVGAAGSGYNAAESDGDVLRTPARAAQSKESLGKQEHLMTRFSIQI